MSSDEFSTRFRETFASADGAAEDRNWDWGPAPEEAREWTDRPTGTLRVAIGVGVDAEGEEDSTWILINLEPILAGDEELESPPAMLERTDGHRLLYRRKAHAVFGEPESTKGWLACLATRERILAGEHVLYIDFDDQDASVIVNRLRMVGLVDDEIRERFHYVAPDEPFDDDSRVRVERILDTYEPILAVLDGFTDALTLHGIDMRDNSEVASWMRGLPRLLRRRDCAVVLIDHVTRDKEKRGGYAIGAQHKLAKVDVAYELTVSEDWGRELTGRTIVMIRKDRPGHIKRLGTEHGGVVAEFIGKSDGEELLLELEPPQERLGPKDDGWRPTGYMEKVSRALEIAPAGRNTRALRTDVGGKSDYVDKARDQLVAEGFVRKEEKGQERIYHSIRAYREAEDPEAERWPDA